MTRRRSGLPGQAKLRRILNRTGWHCWLCGELVYYMQDGNVQLFESGPFVLTIDHVRPWSEGGTMHELNLGAAHQICNERRGSREGRLTEAEETLVKYIFRTDPHGLYMHERTSSR